MGKKKKPTKTAKPSPPKCPGIPLELFRAGVEALVALRNSGDYLVFVPRPDQLKFVGNVVDLQRSLAQRLNREVGVADAEKVLDEVANFCGSHWLFAKVDALVEFLERSVFDDAFKSAAEDDKVSFREALKEKAKLTAEAFVSEAVRNRLRRLETATEPCLEDVDVELVTKRHDDFAGKTVDIPFLRLRFRYSDASATELPFFVRFPWGHSGHPPAKSFELECDESDIDLLLHRLTRAKRLLPGFSQTPDDAEDGS